MMLDLALLREVETIARRAGEAILRVYAGKFSIAQKDDHSPLTEADTAAHAIIVEALAQLTPSVPILSEEAVEAFPRSFTGPRYWLVDPLDGRKEFIKRNGEFTVNVALIEEGRPVLGVVHAPAIAVTYMAADGLGSFHQRGDDTAHSIQITKHCAASPWRVVRSRSHGAGALHALLERLGAHTLVPMGSSLKFCLVAEGSADLYPRLGPTSLWDTAAAQCVVEQAGGSVVTLAGEPLRYDNPNAVINPWFVAHGNRGADWPRIIGEGRIVSGATVLPGTSTK